MKKFILVFFAALAFAQCKNEPPKEVRPPGERTEIGNFEFWHHLKNEGAKPLPGQAVFYNYQIRKGGKVIQSNFGDAPSGGILQTVEEATSNPQAIGEALRRMAVGDSITIIYPSPEGPDSNLVYDVVLKGIYNR